MAALESVFSMDELKVFVALPRVEKMEQLQDLLEIVSGVRLFNRDCKKGGEEYQIVSVRLFFTFYSYANITTVTEKNGILKHCNPNLTSLLRMS